MMAFGDPAATIAGKTLGGPSLPWNREKTWVGFLADWAIGGFASVLVFAFVSGRGFDANAVAILMIGAGIYAFLESVRSGLDDNLVAPLPTALAIYAMAMTWPPELPAGSDPKRVGAALLINVVVAGATAALRIVRPSGAVAGAVLGFLVLVLGGWKAYAVLWAFFLLGTLATKLGYAAKRRAGLAQPDSGRRGAAHVVANGLVPAALLALGAPLPAFVAAFAAALADTLGTEIGTLYGKKAYAPLGLRPLPAGTPGAISVAGTVASLLGSSVLAALAWALGAVPEALAPVVALAGCAGALVESAVNDLGRRFGFRLDHEFANALNTFVAAVLTLRFTGTAA
jgi:uncharacterized protein (TIGR00297 family)